MYSNRLDVLLMAIPFTILNDTDTAENLSKRIEIKVFHCFGLRPVKW